MTLFCSHEVNNAGEYNVFFMEEAWTAEQVQGPASDPNDCKQYQEAADVLEGVSNWGHMLCSWD